MTSGPFFAQEIRKSKLQPTRDATGNFTIREPIELGTQFRPIAGPEYYRTIKLLQDLYKIANMISIDILSICFWAVLAAYLIHIVDETLMGGGFVQKVREHWWPQYHSEMFFWFNAAVILIIIICISLYDLFGGHWIILPLLWTFGRAFHVITVHIWWSIRYREYSPGLVTGILFWILVYFIIRYGLRPGLIGRTDFIIGTIGGFAGALFLAFLPTTIMPRISRRNPKLFSS